MALRSVRWVTGHGAGWADWAAAVLFPAEATTTGASAFPLDAGEADDMSNPRIRLHQGDLPAGLQFPIGVAIDTETLGLKPHRDRLCVVQLSPGDGSADVVQIAAGKASAPNLAKLLKNKKITKIFHFGRFDLAERDDAVRGGPGPRRAAT